MIADLRRLLRELSRATSRHRALLAGGLAAAAVSTALPSLVPSAPPGRRVLTFARDLAAGTSLRPTDLAPVTVPPALVPAGAIRTADEALGRLLAGPVRRGEALTDVRLLGASLLAAGGVRGLVATPVRLADSASASLLHPGDHVDVLAAATTDPTAGGATGTTGAAAGDPARPEPADGSASAGGSSAGGSPAGGASAGGSPAATVVASHALLLAVPGPVGDADGALIVVAVPPPIAARLAAAAVTSRLSVTVLAP